MEQRAGAQISAKAFTQSVLILLALMLVAGILTQVVPAGSYARVTQAGREVIDPASFQIVARPAYPIWRWATAPVEVLWGPNGVTVITIILFLVMVGAAFAVLDRCGILKAAIARIVRAFGGRKYALLLVVSLFFMALGAFFGIFEEVVPLVPLMLALSYYLGWDSLVGLGMSILATNLGFSAAITNPFTIGVAQKIAGLPLFSGAWLRVLIFAAIYAVFALFLTGYARKIERSPEASLVYAEDRAGRAKYASLSINALTEINPRLGRAMVWFLGCLALILLVLVSGPLLPAISQFSLPLVGILFLIAGLGAGLLSGAAGRDVWKAAGQGISGIAPGILLILMAVSIQHIVAQGGIMDTLLHSASTVFSQASPFAAAVLVYFLALLIEFFVASGSAKAFLLMPILLPLADLVGVTRQVAVTAYCFGDGFSNLAYPTNPVLLICLGLTVVSYPKWLKWTLKLWFWILLVTLAFLGLGVAIRYGPF
ncbi:MAG: AbgT family transporter [Chloroflexi bacterium]|nr:AbgT family transporter [Chloroflexota bacterium]